MKLIVIGIAGKARVGKTTLAHAIYDYVTHEAELEGYALVGIYSLAGALKKECAEATGLDIINFDDPAVKETLRPLMQWWGTEFRRNPLLGGDNDYWVNRVKDSIDGWEASAKVMNDPALKALIAVIPDVRFENEVDLVLSYPHGIMVHLDGVGAEETRHVTHASEAGIDTSRMTCRYVNDHTIGSVEIVRIVKSLYAERIEPIIS